MNTTDRVSYTRDEAAQATGLSTRSLDRLIADGSLTSHRFGTKVLVMAKDLAAFIESLPTHRETA